MANNVKNKFFLFRLNQLNARRVKSVKDFFFVCFLQEEKICEKERKKENRITWQNARLNPRSIEVDLKHPEQPHPKDINQLFHFIRKFAFVLKTVLEKCQSKYKRFNIYSAQRREHIC